MNREVFGSLAELAGAIAVVASLFYVGRQVRESSLATRGKTLNSLTNSLNTAAYEALNRLKRGQVRFWIQRVLRQPRCRESGQDLRGIRIS